jgi:hypothetical protein
MKRIKSWKWGKIGKVTLALMLAMCFVVVGMNITLERNKDSPIKVQISVGNPVDAFTGSVDFVGLTDTAVQLALNALPATGGEVQLISPAYTFSATVSRAIDNVTFKGNNGTTVTYAGACFSVGVQSGWIFKDIKVAVGGSITNSARATLFNVTIGANFIAYQLSSLATGADFITDVTGNLAGNVVGSISGGTVSGSSLTGTGLTAGYVPYVGGGGTLTNEAGFEYNAGTDTLKVDSVTGSISGGTVSGTTVTATGLTPGLVPYVGAGGLLSNEAGFAYDSTTNTLSVGHILVTDISSIVGVEWNQSTNSWGRIDALGVTTTLSSDYFNANPVWGGMARCTLTSAGVPTYGYNARGDGLDLTGASGRVMVEIPKFYVKSANPAANVYQWWVSPSYVTGYTIHPAFVQRGGTVKDHIYVGAYDADFDYDGANAAYNAANEKLHSRTGKQPYTGNANCIWSIPIDDLGADPAIGDRVSTPTDTDFYIVDYLKTAGAWGGGGAGDTATIWLRKPGDDTCGMVNGEVLTNNTSATTIGNTTAGSTGRSVTISHARTLAENIGSKWGIMNIWSLTAIQLLFYTEYAGANSQTLVGKGITGKPGGTGFAGEISGFNTSDTNIAVNGTGSGTGVNDSTPIVYRGIENLWGNVWQFIDGFIAVDTAYQIIKRNGTGVFATPMAVGNYESSVAAPIANAGNDGYISNIVYEDLLTYTFFASAVAGLSTNYLYDYWYAHRTGNTNILAAGGCWVDGAAAGVGYRSSDGVAGSANRYIGARVEFIGP